jgi:hypothetical protein
VTCYILVGSLYLSQITIFSFEKSVCTTPKCLNSFCEHISPTPCSINFIFEAHSVTSSFVSQILGVLIQNWGRESKK